MCQSFRRLSDSCRRERSRIAAFIAASAIAGCYRGTGRWQSICPRRPESNNIGFGRAHGWQRTDLPVNCVCSLRSTSGVSTKNVPALPSVSQQRALTPDCAGGRSNFTGQHKSADVEGDPAFGQIDIDMPTQRRPRCRATGYPGADPTTLLVRRCR
jgi:hypothetical protein